MQWNTSPEAAYKTTSGRNSLQELTIVGSQYFGGLLRVEKQTTNLGDVFGGDLLALGKLGQPRCWGHQLDAKSAIEIVMPCISCYVH